jgi:hypothetical protein
VCAHRCTTVTLRKTADLDAVFRIARSAAIDGQLTTRRQTSCRVSGVEQSK